MGSVTRFVGITVDSVLTNAEGSQKKMLESSKLVNTAQSQNFTDLHSTELEFMLTTQSQFMWIYQNQGRRWCFLFLLQNSALTSC